MNKQRKKHKKRFIVLMIVGVLFVSFFSLSLLKDYESPGLIGRWQSEETGEVIRFTKDGQVVFKNGAPTGVYYIISPDKMEYTVDGFTFNMIYQLEAGSLYWGVTKDHLEHFVKK